MLAGISLEWYTLFEMGRERAMTEKAVEAVARALRLFPTERDYVRDLTRPMPPPAPLMELPPALELGLKTDITKMLVVYDRWLNPVRWNVVGELLLSLGTYDPSKRNALWQFFCAPETRELYAEWEHFAALFLGLFRRSLGRDPANDEAQRLLGILKESADFRKMWDLNEVFSLADEARSSMHNVYHLHTHRFGEVRGYTIGLGIPGTAGGHVRVGTPADEAGRRMLEDAAARLGVESTHLGPPLANAR